MVAIPTVARWVLQFTLSFVLLGALSRLAFHWYFSSGASGLGVSELASAYWLGARYDLRLALILCIPVLLLSLHRRLSLFSTERRLARGWIVYFGLLTFGWVLVTFVDFAHYAYLGTKLASSIFLFAQDADASATMVWQTYPVVKLVLAWIALSLFIFSGLLAISRKSQSFAAEPFTRRGQWIFWGGATLLITLGIHGRFSQYPLRWSDAYVNPSPFLPALALNPVLNLYDTRKYVGGTYDLARVKEAYPRMASYLGVDRPDAKSLDFGRVRQAVPPLIPGQPNIVLVLMESFSAYKSSLSGNALDTTPNLNALAKQSIVFDRFFTPHAGTARGVFATLTGIPDVDLRNTSSRNPAAVDQHSLVNALTGYESHYFIGGSTTWANVRGVIKKNIPNLQIHEEGSFKSPVVDVWGISDKNLFMEANAIIARAEKPFFAIIQTAGNHRPYTIPSADTDFEIKSPSLDQLRANGFFSVEEYNAFRYMDYAVGNFMSAARKERYYENTVFVFLGDHGISVQGHDIGPHMPRSYQDLKLSSVHTPLIIHAPKYLSARRIQAVGSQIDVMPTILGLTGVKHRVQSLGRNLLDPSLDDRRLVFTVYHDGVGEIGLLDGTWYYIKKAKDKKGGLYALTGGNPVADQSASNPEQAERFNQLLDDYYQTAMYMLTNNRQQPHPN